MRFRNNVRHQYRNSRERVISPPSPPRSGGEGRGEVGLGEQGAKLRISNRKFISRIALVRIVNLLDLNIWNMLTNCRDDAVPIHAGKKLQRQLPLAALRSHEIEFGAR